MKDNNVKFYSDFPENEEDLIAFRTFLLTQTLNIPSKEFEVINHGWGYSIGEGGEMGGWDGGIGEGVVVEMDVYVMCE